MPEILHGSPVDIHRVAAHLGVELHPAAEPSAARVSHLHDHRPAVAGDEEGAALKLSVSAAIVGLAGIVVSVCRASPKALDSHWSFPPSGLLSSDNEVDNVDKDGSERQNHRNVSLIHGGSPSFSAFLNFAGS